MTVDALKEAEAARVELGAALAAAGVTLPSLGVDLVAYSHQRPYALVELGRCNVATARALAAALRAGSAPCAPS
ncbi:hypothetical protein RCO28_19010 [Streptomyces sp. LHD-70]|uniref:hypothetical protein n=1 Tax=Streptomyces sp. LHD-70 TaxID=3072140 RepID=UPI00280D2676|nr:hypothetical protein [Streptomyces sp. LHD-70]MDQ8704563.1 hypothetical protein [Streptomyces sp. LHD-70]